MAIGDPVGECGRKEPLHGRRELAGTLQLDLPVDQWPERLHEVAGKVVGVCLGMVVDADLVEIALRRDPARCMREQDGITIVEGIVGRVRVRCSDESGTEQRLEIAAGPGGLAPGRIVRADLSRLGREQLGLLFMARSFEDGGLVIQLALDDLLPQHLARPGAP